MPRLEDGSVAQSGLRHYEEDYAHEDLNYTVLGVVTSLVYSDDRSNRSSVSRADFRGSRCEADVLCVNDEKDNPWIIPKVVILPRGSSGVDNFYEELPTSASQMIDGSGRDTKGRLVDPYQLDGDFCVVGFIGGNIKQPYMVGWWPHPGNRKDPATIDIEDRGVLPQGRRLARRFQGTKMALTSEGSVFLDTSEANAEVSYNETGIVRKGREGGGDIRISVKKERELEVNFNPPVPNPENEPDLLQPNPSQGKNERQDDLSRYFMSKDFINAVAGRVVRLMGNNDGTDKKNTVLLGENPDPTMGHLLLGEKVQLTFNALVASHNSLVNKFNTHSHIGNSGSPTSTPNESPPVENPLFDPLKPPSQPANPPYLSTPADPATDAGGMPDTDLSEVSVTE